MNKDLKIKISIDNQTKEIKVIQDDMKKLSNNIDKANETTRKFQKSMARMGHISSAIIGLDFTFDALSKTISNTLGVGINYNRSIEQLTNGLTTLNAITSSNTTTLGRHISVQEKYALATKEAKEQVQKLSEINKQTPHTLTQTVEIYKAMFPSMRKVGASTNDLLEITKKLSIAAGANGIQFQQLLAGVDGLATGTVLANSELGRFLNTLGLSNAELKKSDNVVALIQSKLKDVKAIQDFDTVLSNLGNSFSIKAGEFTKPLFNDMKAGMLELTKVIDGLEIENIKEVSKEIAKIGTSALVAYSTVRIAKTLYPIISGLARNFNLVNTQLVIGIATARAKTIAMRTLGNVLKMTPFGIATMAVGFLADKFLFASDKADMLRDSIIKTRKELEKLSLAELKKENLDYNLKIKELEKQVEEQKKKTYIKLGGHLSPEYTIKLDKNDEKRIRAEAEIEKLQREIQKTKEALKDIEELKAKTNEKLASNTDAEAQKKAKELEEKKKQLAQYYKFVNDKDQLWIAKQKEITDKFKGLGKEKLDHALKVARESIFGTAKINKKSLDERKKVLRDFQNAYNQSTLSNTQYQLLELKKRYDKFALHVNDKVKLNEWYKNESEKITEQESQAKQNALINYYEKMGQYKEAWALKEKSLSKNYNANLDPSQAKDMLEMDKQDYFSKNMDDPLEKQKNSYVSMLESQKELIDSTNIWTDSLHRSFKGVKNIADAFTKFASNKKASEIALAKLDKQHYQELKKAGKDKQKLAQIEKKYTQDNAKLKLQAQQNEIKSYASIASSMRGLFKEGSDGSNALMVTESALATVNAVNAVLSQGQGDPYTAIPRMAAMAATAGSLLANIGQSLGFNKQSVSKDAFASQKANDGSGTVLGDSTAKTKSIEKSLQTLERYAKPEHSLLMQMNRSLKSIDEKTKGMSADIFKFGTNELGKDFKDYSKDGLGDKFKNILDKMPLDKFSKKLSGVLTGDFVTAKILNGIWGRKKVSLDDSGFRFNTQSLKDLSKNGIDLKGYQVVKTKQRKFFKKSVELKSHFSDVNDKIKRNFTKIFTNIGDTIVGSSKILGKSKSEIETKLSNFKLFADANGLNDGKVSLKDKSAKEIGELLNSIVGKEADKMVMEIFPKMAQFQKVGEGGLDTYTRVTTGLESSNYLIDKLGKDYNNISYSDLTPTDGDVGLGALKQSIQGFEEATYPVNNNLLEMVNNFQGTNEELFNFYTTLDGLRDSFIFLGEDANFLSEDLIKGAGGVENLQKSTNFYFKHFLSKEEQLAYNTQKLKKEFDKINVAMPQTRAEFKALLEQLGDKGDKETYGEVLALSRNFYEYTSYYEQEQERRQRAYAREAEQRARELERSRKALFNNEKKRIDELIKGYDKSKNHLKSVFDTAKGTIKSILGDNKAYTKNQYFSHLQKARSLQELVKKDPLNTKNTKAFLDNVKEASSFAKGYLKKDNFDNELDYKFAQLTSANTFKEFENTASIYDKVDELISEVKELKDNAKTQRDLTEAIALFERRSADILEEIHNQNLSNNAQMGVAL